MSDVFFVSVKKGITFLLTNPNISKSWSVDIITYLYIKLTTVGLS